MPVTQLVPPPPGLSSELLLEFFLVFSRLEYAMKAAGWLRQNSAAAEPDWGRLINDVQAQQEVGDLLEAGSYLLDSPPKKQVRAPDGSLGWSPEACDDDQRRVSCLLWSVKRVRNNLFHGGKFEALGNLSDRNRRLVEGSLNVLERLLELSICEPIRGKYYGFAEEPA